MRQFAILCIYAAAVLAPAPGMAQSADPHLGGRIRITMRSTQEQEGISRSPSASGQRLIGHWIGSEWDSLLLLVGDERMAVPFDSVHNVEASRGMRSSASSGAVAGALAGGLLLGAAASSSASGCDQWCVIDSGAAFGIGFALGAVGGAVVGAAIGALIRTERWERLPRNRWMMIRPVTTASGFGVAISL